MSTPECTPSGISLVSVPATLTPSRGSVAVQGVDVGTMSQHLLAAEGEAGPPMMACSGVTLSFPFSSGEAAIAVKWPSAIGLYVSQSGVDLSQGVFGFQSGNVDLTEGAGVSVLVNSATVLRASPKACVTSTIRTSKSRETAAPVDPWASKNIRRGELIEKEVTGNLAPDEKTELDRLQAEVTANVYAQAPLPLERLRKINRQLRRRNARRARQVVTA